MKKSPPPPPSSTPAGVGSPGMFPEFYALVAEAERRDLAVPQEVEYAMLHHEAVKRGIFPYDTFTQFIQALNPSLLSYEHIPAMVKAAERVVADPGVFKRPRSAPPGQRVMVLAVPRYFKSEIFSRLLPAYYLRKFPERTVALNSYGADLAWELSEDARSYFQQSYGVFRKDTQAKKRWGTTDNGEMWAAGVGGPGLGRGFDLGIVDDPMDPERVFSAIYQRRFMRWWVHKFLRGQQPGASIIVVMQRLSAEDPIDYLFRCEVGEGDAELDPQYWHVVVLDEIKSDEPLGRWDGPQGLPPTCTLEPDHRKAGELLAPSWFSRQQVTAIHRRKIVAAAQRQQRPYQASGDFWKQQWFRTYTQLPRTAYDGGKDWDTAYTKDEANSATAYIESYRGPGEVEEFPIYIENVAWAWKEFPELVKWMGALKGPHYIEEKASGKSAAQSLKASGVVTETVPVKGDKFSRAVAVQPTVSTGRVYVREDLLDTLLTGEGQGLLRITAEMLQMGQGGLDLNDAFTQALHRHLGLHKKAGRKKVVWA